jgi:voltage-gated potassium channel Kch
MEVCMAVVTVPDPATSTHIVQLIRRLRPNLNIAVRCRFNRYKEALKEAGADMIVDEEIITGQMLSQMIVDSIEESSGSAMACRMAGQEPDSSV